jgi:hypothetical protein
MYSKSILFLIFSLTTALSVGQNWTLKDSGAGLIVIDDNANKPVKIIRRNTTWDLKYLQEKGAIDGKFNGNQLFAAWIQGPESKEFLNNKGKPAWLCKYRIIYPDGKTFESKPQEFLSSGYSCFGIKPGDYTEGVWKVEWFLVNREKLKENHVATIVFQSTWGQTGQKTSFKVKATEDDIKIGSKPKVIFDTDLDSDVDDVGALAMLLNMHKAGIIELAGIIVTSDDPYSPLCADAICTYYREEGIPVAFYMGNSSLTNHSRYSKIIADEFPAGIASWAEAEGSTRLYRRLLGNCADNSVIIITVGHLSSLQKLIESSSDKFSSLNGKDLVLKKVQKWICMGGQYPEGKEANFFRPDPKSTVYCIQNWMKEVIFVGWEAGNEIMTGGNYLKSRLESKNPVYRSYELYNNFSGRSSWDQLAVLQLTDISERFFNYSNYGLCIVASDGSNKWIEDKTGNHRYIILKPGIERKEIATFIDNLMIGL